MKILFRVVLGLLVIAGIYLSILQVTKKTDAPAQADAPAPPPKPVTEERVVLKAQSCSLKAPTGWEQTTEDEGGIMFIAPKEKYVANLLVVNLPFTEPLDKFVEQQLAKFKTANPNAVIDKPAAFTTDSGSAALKVTAQNKIGDLELTQMLYFMDGNPGQKLMLTTGGPPTQRGELEPLFDSCVKSVTVIAP